MKILIDPIKAITALLVLLTAGTANAQHQKLKVLETDYIKWGVLDFEEIAPNGEWSSYSMVYDEGPDTLFVQEVSTGRRFQLPEKFQGRFSSDSKWFTASASDGTLEVLNLADGGKRHWPGVLRHEFHQPENMLVMLCKKGIETELVLWDYQKGTEYSYAGVTEFSISRLGYITIIKSGIISIIYPHQHYMEVTVDQDPASNYKNAVWDDQGNQLAFIRENPASQYTLCSYDTRLSKLYSLDTVPGTDGPEVISPPLMITPLFFSPAGESIFFSSAAIVEVARMPDITEVWDTANPLDYPQQANQGDIRAQEKLTRWSPGTGAVDQIASEALPKVLLTPDRNYALCYNQLHYEPQFELYAPVDVSIMNLLTGVVKPMLSKQLISRSTLMASPLSNYISYFRNDDWWIYDIRQDSHTNVTAPLNKRFSADDVYAGGDIEAYGSPGWSVDDKYFFVYGQFDIWMIDSSTKKALRITDGEEKRSQYRIAESFIKNYPRYASVNFGKPGFDLSKAIPLLSVNDNKSCTYYLWRHGHGLQPLVNSKIGLSRMQQASDSNAWIYIEQSASQPPQLKYISDKTWTKETLYASNSHAEKFEVPKADLISFSTPGRKKLKGILYYPPAFEPAKKYPMIVYIYEKLSDNFHQYTNPSLYANHGFNPINYCLDGYLVLLPDIAYRTGKPGESALECVSAAVEKVKAMGSVASDKMGLIGHSFGGYEVTYLIGRTDIFATAVAGAPINDLISYYLSIHWDTAHSNMWRLEQQQYRMGGSAFKNYQNYVDNSPITNAPNISTPLLMWSGKKDGNVNWSQALEMQMALRRLHKRSVLLVYPTEGHVVDDPALQKDLSLRIKVWFDGFLK